ncbi:MAG: tetratricopeptide repeat protein, partial [Nitrospira sp.]|nr:tetratricopeptide repeat protein [Nitrospira sp.]
HSFLILSLTFQATPVLAGEAQDLLGKAYASYQQEQWDSAISQLEQAIASYPRYAEAHHLLSLIHSQQG